MLKGGRCIRAALSAHLDGWEGMTCTAMREQLSDKQCHVIPCSRCKEPADASIPWTPFPSDAIPVDWNTTRFNSWREWVYTSHLKAPPPDERKIVLDWGCHPLAPTSAAINELTRLRQYEARKALEGKHTIAKILRLLSPVCVACLVDGVCHTNITAHCKQSCRLWKPTGLNSNLTSPGKRAEIGYSAWKESWASHVFKSKIHGVCFSCMLPESNVFHQVSGNHITKEYECIFPDLVPPLVWSLRQNDAFRHQLRDATDARVNTLDDFDSVSFTISQGGIRGLCNGANALVRYWYALVHEPQGWPSVDLEQSILDLIQSLKRN